MLLHPATVSAVRSQHSLIAASTLLPACDSAQCYLCRERMETNVWTHMHPRTLLYMVSTLLPGVSVRYLITTEYILHLQLWCSGVQTFAVTVNVQLK